MLGLGYIMQELCMNDVWIYGLFEDYVRILNGLCVYYVRIMPRLCNAAVSIMHGLCVDYARIMYGLCVDYQLCLNYSTMVGLGVDLSIIQYFRMIQLCLDHAWIVLVLAQFSKRRTHFEAC